MSDLSHTPADGASPDEVAALREQNAELQIQLRELRETLDAIHGGDVDALVVNGDIYTLESAGASANRLREDVLSQMEDAVFAFDAEGRIIFLNSAAEARYTIKASSALGRSVEQVFTEVAAPEEEYPAFERSAGDSARPGKLARHILRDGSSIYVETVVSALTGANGLPMGSLSVVRDVSERVRGAALLRESEARLRQINEDLESAVRARTGELLAAQDALRQAQKMEAVGQLTGGIAHDFNNLLAIISTSLQVLHLKSKSGAVDGLDRYIDMAQGSVTRAAALTQRLLAFARRQTLDPKALDVNQLVEGLVDLIGRTVGPTVRIVVDAQPGLWLAKLDGSQLENSILNLCINARDAMRPGGGTLTIRTRNLPPRPGADGERVSLQVIDTGSGMPDDVAARAFDPFFTTKPAGQGTGLGLSMVYGFAKQSGGDARIESVPGAGSTVTLVFPRFGGAAVPSAAAEVPALVPTMAHGEVVLLVEDEDKLRALIAEALEFGGFQVIEAADGASALEALRGAAQVDLLLSDVGLPGGMNGRQVAMAARELRPGIRVLFVTGYAESAALREGILDEGMALITKPFDLATLVQKAREMATLK